MKRFALFLFFIASTIASAQRLSIFNIDNSAFPTIKAEYFAFDSTGRQLFNLTPSDFTLTENGVARNVTLSSCKPKNPLITLSSVLTIDMSGSMANYPMDVASTAAKSWIALLSGDNSECAVTGFETVNYLLHDFTTNQDRLVHSLNILHPYFLRYYNKGFIEPPAGALLISAKGKYKRIIVFITNGEPLDEPKVNEIVAEAQRQNCSVYSVVISTVCPQRLKDISTLTGGVWFENIESEEEIRGICQQIYAVAQGAVPCKIEWTSGFNCSTNPVKVNAKVPAHKIETDTSYLPSANSVAELKFEPEYITFKNIPAGITRDTVVTITAINSAFNVTKITTLNPAFKIDKANFSLAKGESIRIKVSYTPIDSGFAYTRFFFENDICTSFLYCSAVRDTKKGTKKILKLTHPNGGEAFVVGTDTLITWEGIYENDTVKLEYSTDNGSTWLTITDSATGLKYIWKNIPEPASNQCLVKIKQNKFAIGDTNIIPKIEWKKNYGGSETDVGYEVQLASDGGYLVTGLTSSVDGDLTTNKGNNDIWFFKTDQNGNSLWHKTFGGQDSDYGKSIEMIDDNNYIIIGNADSRNGDIPNSFGSYNHFIMGTNSTGNLQWIKPLVENSSDNMYHYSDITRDQGFITVGCKETSTDNSAILSKSDKNGELEWRRDFGFQKNELFCRIHQVDDGGYLAVGKITSNSFYKYHSDALIVKFNKFGDIKWQKTIGDSIYDYDYFISFEQTADGGYIVVGRKYSIVADSTSYRLWGDTWILKFDYTGEIEWQKIIGGSKDDTPKSVIQNDNGDYLIVGSSHSNDGTLTKNNGSGDCWIFELNQKGELKWQISLGSTGLDEALSIIQTDDYGYIVQCNTNINDADFCANSRKTDCWLVKLSSEIPSEQEDVSDSLFSIVQPIPYADDIDMKQCLLDKSKDSLITNFVGNKGTYKVSIDSIYFIGNDADCFKMISGFPQYEIEPNQTHQAEIRFTPERIGLHSAKIVIITNTDTLIKNIIGEGVKQKIEIIKNIVDFDSVLVNTHKDTLVSSLIKNVSNTVVKISSIKFISPNSTDFTLSSGNPDTTFNLLPNEQANIKLRFSPTELGRVTGQIEINYNSLGSPAGIQLLGTGYTKAPRISSVTNDFPVTNCYRPVLSIIKVSNSGVEPLKISKISIKGNDEGDFRYEGNSALTIESDSSKEITIIFQPKKAGKKTAELELISNAYKDSIHIIPLSAEMDSVELSVDKRTIDLGYFCPNTSKEEKIKISNTGSIRTGGTIKTTDNLSSDINSFVVKKDDFITLNVKFLGLSPLGRFTEKVFIVDSVCGNVDSVLISGEIVQQELNADEIVLGFLCPGETKDTVISVSNVGKLNFNGQVSVSSNISIFNQVLLLNSGDQIQIPLKFTGIGNETLFTETMTFSESDCGYSKVINIKGNIVKPKLEAVDLNISSILNVSNIGSLTIHNPTERDIYINNLPNITNPFSLVGNPFPALIKAKDSIIVKIEFLSTDTLQHSLSFTLSGEPCNITKEIQINGLASPARAVLKAGSCEAYSGDMVEIPIILSEAQNLPIAGITGFNAELGYNSTVLAPLEHSGIFIDETCSKILLANLPLTDTVTKIKFTAGLGNDEVSELKLIKIEPIGGIATIENHSGTFKLLGVCNEGGKRLFYGSGKAGLLSIIPNPADDEITLTINTIETGESCISIFNTLGMLIDKIIIKNDYLGTKEIKINTSTFANGVYYIKYQTSTLNLYQKLIIGR